MFQDSQLEMDEVVGMDLYHVPSVINELSRTNKYGPLTQYFVVCRTNALWLPPALESPWTGCPRVLTKS